MGTNGCPQEALAARQRQSRQAMPAAPGMPGAARQILAMAVKAQVTAASRADPVPGINRDAVRAPAADAGRRQARAARHLAGVPGRRLMPAAQPAKSPGTPPGDGDLDAAAAHPGQGGGSQPALPAGPQPSRGALATGHVGPRRAPTGARVRAATGPAAPPAQTVASAQDCLLQAG